MTESKIYADNFKCSFSKKELMVLKFAESDIDRAMQEGKENV